LESVESGQTLFKLRKDLLLAISNLELGIESVVLVDVRPVRRKSMKEPQGAVAFSPHMSWKDLKQDGIVEVGFGYWNALFRKVFGNRATGIIVEQFDGLARQSGELLAFVVGELKLGEVDFAKGVWNGAGIVQENKEGGGLDASFEKALIEIQQDLASLVFDPAVDESIKWRTSSMQSLGRGSLVSMKSASSVGVDEITEDLFDIQR
jgi:hypothetical protein